MFMLRTRTKTSIRNRFMPTLLMLAIATVAHAQTFSALYNFGTKSNDSTNPQYSGIIAQGRDGDLHSAAPGGTDGVGAMFKITPAGVLTVPYTFDLYAEPYGGLTLGTDGNYYGTTNSGGTANLGTVFKITAGGKLTVLHEFTNTGDGAYPYAPPIEGADGNYYGTTTQANLANGTVYKVTSAGVFTALHSFDVSEGQYPFAPLVQGADGNFYGTAQLGGTSTQCVGGCGTVFKITSAGALSVLYNFDELHGEAPLGPLIQATDGNFYGTTTGGGTNGPNCCGVIFQITSAGALTVLHDFGSPDDGINPMAGLVQATDGNLYGTTAGGGADEAGIIFSITPKIPFAYNILYAFDGATGSSPQATMVQHTNGILYGDTQAGGTDTKYCGPCGTFYSLNMGLKPFLRLVSTSGKVGTSAEILGQGFTGTTQVSFGGTSAITFNASSSTFLTAKVPAGALTGPVVVTTPGGTLTSTQTFRVTPQVTGFTPGRGPVGTSVQIKGVSLTQATMVEFGSQSASFQIDSDTLITATVPAGATTGQITITTLGGSATSKGVFTVTP